MGAAGLPTPLNYIIKTPRDLPKAAKHVGFPAVLKPISGAASLGVIRVDSEADLHRRAFRRAALATHGLACTIARAYLPID